MKMTGVLAIRTAVIVIVIVITLSRSTSIPGGDEDEAVVVHPIMSRIIVLEILSLIKIS